MGAAFAVHVLVEKRYASPMRAAVDRIANRCWPR
jgi:hypothetical protein